MGWTSGSFSDDGWAGCGNPALKELLTGFCCLLDRTLRVKAVPWDLAFLSGTENNIHLLEIYRNIVT